MEMQVDRELIRNERERRAWSQSHLAAVAGLGLRTVQRIEATGNAAYESAAAIATVLSLTVADLVPVDAAGSATATAPGRDGESPAAPGKPEPERAKLSKYRPTRTAIQLAAVAGIVAAAVLILASIRAPRTDVSASQPDVSPAEPVVAAGGEVPVNCPVDPVETFLGRSQLHLEIECESVDPDWAPAVERQLRSLALGYLADRPEISGRFSLERVRCRATICEIEFLNSAPTGPAVMKDGVMQKSPLWALRHELFAEPWGAQFDPWQTTLIGSLVDGDSHLYLKRMPSAL
jgi:hypothetical protein